MLNLLLHDGPAEVALMNDPQKSGFSKALMKQAAKAFACGRRSQEQSLKSKKRSTSYWGQAISGFCRWAGA
jgi:hypothetical protein